MIFLSDLDVQRIVNYLHSMIEDLKYQIYEIGGVESRTIHFYALELQRGINGANYGQDNFEMASQKRIGNTRIHFTISQLYCAILPCSHSDCL